MNAAARDALAEPLPPDVVAGGGARWTRYRLYPVFSARWLTGRSLLFAIAIGAFALLSAFGIGFASRDYGTGLLVGAYTFAAFMLMATAGPAFAAVVRHRRWPRRRERLGIVVAMLVGMASSYAADDWASAHIERRVEAAMSGLQPGQPQVRMGPGVQKPQVDTVALRERLGSAPPIERALALTVNILVLILVYGAFGGGLSLRAYFSEQRRREAGARQREMDQLRETKRVAEMRLGVLQAQVEPHFLFNTLAAVRALLRERPAQAEATLDALVGYLRASIPRFRDDAERLDSTLGDQIGLCTHYLDVMRLRSGDRLTYSVDVAAGVRDLPFPPLLLITLVENAVKHGVEPKPGPGHIALHARCEGGRLCVEVHDDGVGLRPGLHSGGLGLANVREQLLARHGDAASLRLQARPSGGTLAVIDVPAECP